VKEVATDNRPVALFDSGVGGLSIWRAVRRLLPRENLLFLADAACAPYGLRSPAELRGRVERLARFLIEQDAKLVVVACNTATVHALDQLRAVFSETPFVGVVPVVKTLARYTRTQSVAVLSTPATATSPYLDGLIRDFAPGMHVVNVGCDGLAELVDQGEVRGPQVIALVEQFAAPVRGSAADVLGLGCTHYAFLRGSIKRAVGSGVRIYEPSRPVARQVRRVLAEQRTLGDDPSPRQHFVTTGDPERFATVGRRLLRFPLVVEHIDL
jgi:glutamate racemase